MGADTYNWLVIGGMAAITYVTRATGLIAGRWLPMQGRVHSALAAVPGCVLVALLIPRVVHGGVAEWSAAAATMLLAGGRRPAVLAIGGGVLLLVVLRHFTE